MTDTQELVPVLRDDTLYLGDNGRCFCGEMRCAGMTPYFTGRDLSGQRVLRITSEMADRMARDGGQTWPTCEMCGKRIWIKNEVQP